MTLTHRVIEPDQSILRTRVIGAEAHHVRDVVVPIDLLSPGAACVLAAEQLMEVCDTGRDFGRVVFGAPAVLALRGVYCALMEESRIPRRLTGTTVGIVSVGCER